MDKTYVVKAGDTLFGISKQFGVSVDDIKNANNMTNDIVELGATMIIPDTSVTTYTVKAGDNLYSIARNYGITVDALKNANGLNSNILEIGQILTIPSSGSSSSSITYTVVSGDNLYDIAKKYDTTVEAIKALNNLTSDKLAIGDVLKIPTVLLDQTLPVQDNYFEYVVKAGDNLYDIARRYDVEVDDIKRINNLNGNNLTIGQVLIIGSYPKEMGEVLSCYGDDTNVDSGFVTYIVKAGDSLYSIADKYNTSVSKLKILNNLNGDELSIGQILKVGEV